MSHRWFLIHTNVSIDDLLLNKNSEVPIDIGQDLFVTGEVRPIDAMQLRVRSECFGRVSVWVH